MAVCIIIGKFPQFQTVCRNWNVNLCLLFFVFIYICIVHLFLLTVRNCLCCDKERSMIPDSCPRKSSKNYGNCSCKKSFFNLLFFIIILQGIGTCASRTHEGIVQDICPSHLEHIFSLLQPAVYIFIFLTSTGHYLIVSTANKLYVHCSSYTAKRWVQRVSNMRPLAQ